MEKKRWFNSSLVLLLLSLSYSLPAYSQARAADAYMLNKLNGTWVMSTRRSTIIETWTQQNDSTWTGKTWRVVKNDSTLQQSVMLVKRGEELFFIPEYEGDPGHPARLKLRVLKPIGFVAEDLANDFPKKITYRFKDDRHLDARVEGARDGTIQEYIFNYQKQ
ncbi:hypothetical protein SAMN05660909_03871 [Chitinophaga terrae (ex Kim and Jung 2007)]|uniref:DUF6265 domain-containing protein n=1 Tax=Chitinophaga terrae (ex Kim and Jung 2007) TaxID=408074 RepID=A0A1H4EQH6_9BACT|nr:DUF6265 family protein [Chitinophaga terrae (ex Kim and Jung 2007)]MDQ0107623.1 hypothetical protein [Chitinophaga terrae (ex Kim and Jung 2007)]GEP91774.1 hypothetical protein CTE07_34190 [Chitinophaga terrae (ex Kim and Jung 2007)]SEA86780.1 hypothetical protein SAMN05660909_03871 [Chitinophaga terrae (ex Kim and Jung 2007)]